MYFTFSEYNGDVITGIKSEALREIVQIRVRKYKHDRVVYFKAYNEQHKDERNKASLKRYYDNKNQRQQCVEGLK